MPVGVLRLGQRLRVKTCSVGREDSPDPLLRLTVDRSAPTCALRSQIANQIRDAVRLNDLPPFISKEVDRKAQVPAVCPERLVPSRLLPSVVGVEDDAGVALTSKKVGHPCIEVNDIDLGH